MMEDVSLVRDLSATEAGRERELTARADAQARAALACERQPSTPAFAAPVAVSTQLLRLHLPVKCEQRILNQRSP